MNNTFGKDEKLKKKKYFDALFQHGKGFTTYPVRIIYLPFTAQNFENLDENLPTKSQFAVAVPKKKFKHATDRNRIKRQIREAYRLNKSVLPIPYAIIIVYLSKEKVKYSIIEKSVKECLKQLS